MYYSNVEEDITVDFERAAAGDSISDDGDFDDEPPELGDMKICALSRFFDWRGLVLTEPTEQTHGADELGEYEKQRQARLHRSQPGYSQAPRQLGLA